MKFRQNITRIKGLSDRRRMPLLGKIRLGIKKQAKSGNEYPVETEYFVCPDEVREVFGDQPKSLRIMFPMNDIDSVFPCAYIHYGHSIGVKCKGDGERAECVDVDSGEIVSRSCPCELLESGKCKQVGRLLFMIPSVSVAGCFQITTSSFNSIIDIQSGLDYVTAMVGRFAFIELELRRVPTVTHHENKRQTHHTIQLTLPKGYDAKALADLRADNQRIYTQAQYLLPAPVDENPEFAPIDVVDEENEPESETSGNWWDDKKHWLYRKNPELDHLARIGFGIKLAASEKQQPEFDELLSKHMEAFGVIKSAAQDIKDDFKKKYNKAFGEGALSQLIILAEKLKAIDTHRGTEVFDMASINARIEGEARVLPDVERLLQEINFFKSADAA